MTDTTYKMSSTIGNHSELELKLLPPKLINPTKKSVVHIRNPCLILIIWDILLGIPFSFLIAITNRTFMQSLGYEKIMRCPSGVFASRSIMMAVNLWVVLNWRKQLIQEECEERVRADIKILDEIIACLERVLAGIEAKEIQEQPINDHVRVEEMTEVILDEKGWTDCNQKKKMGARKNHKANNLSERRIIGFRS